MCIWDRGVIGVMGKRACVKCYVLIEAMLGSVIESAYFKHCELRRYK